MRVVWLCPYPVQNLENQLVWGRYKAGGHPCSWIINLAKALGACDDVDLHLITLCPGVARDQVIAHPDGYTLHVLKSGVPFIHRGFPPYMPLDIALAYRVERSKLIAKVRALGPDVVHAHGTEYVYGLAATEMGFPSVISMQGIMSELEKITPTYSFRRRAVLERRAVMRGRFFMGRTHYDKGFVSQLNPEATIFDIPEAMSPVYFEDSWSNPDGMRVLFVGSLLHHKGLPLLLKALEVVSEAYPDITLDLAGPFSETDQQELAQQLESRGARLHLAFHGFLGPEKLASLHRECQMFVLPSLNENSPNTLAEAMASGMPVVAHDVGGVYSMFTDGESGLLVKCGDTKALADAISKVFQNPELRQTLGSNARKLAERNRPDHVAEVTVAAYRQIARQAAR